MKNKWKNLCTNAKQTYNDLNRERSKTGGGPAPKPINEETDHIISLFERKPAFEGLDGFSSFQFTKEVIYQLKKYEISLFFFFSSNKILQASFTKMNLTSLNFKNASFRGGNWALLLSVFGLYTNK